MRFGEEVELYAEAWAVLAEIERNSYVLDPQHPTKKDMNRRLYIEPALSVQVIINPQHPHHLPQVNFMGADHLVTSLLATFASNIELWNEGEDLVSNLEQMLGVVFPSSDDVMSRDELSAGLECGICYNERIEGSLPEAMCDNQHCNKPFHISCLTEWLKFLPTSKHVSDTYFGECPYCEKVLTCKAVS